MFENVTAAAPDAILGLTEAFKADTNPAKINLGVGVYKDEAGETPVLQSVKDAEKRLLEKQNTKSYLPISGFPDYTAAVQRLLFGSEHEIVQSGRIVTAQTPGGTGALRVAGDYLNVIHPEASLWLSNPTWANHNAIFEAAGVEVKTYDYFDPALNGVNIDAFLAAIKNIPAGDVILLHGCCHNPTGADPTKEQWQQIADAIKAGGILPLVDFAYQGFGAGLDEDAAGMRLVIETVGEGIICNSFSKNFGLYNERIGAVNFVASNEAVAANVLSQVKRRIRTNFSNPPAHGGMVVSTILNDEVLYNQWLGELGAMRDRINGMRSALVEKLTAAEVAGDWQFINEQNGMFSYSGLTKEQVTRLKEEFAIYIVGSGRINVAGLTSSNIDRLVEGMKAVC